MKIADLFCGAGGAGKGLHDVGFEVIGFDIEPQKNYPFEFHQQDAFMVDLSEFDAVWASPPCQAYGNLNKGTNGNAGTKLDLIDDVRRYLVKAKLPFIIENVPGSPLIDPILICGSMFDPPMDIRRHRLFECNVPLQPPIWSCRHALYGPRFQYQSHGRKHMSRVVWVYGQNHTVNETPVRMKAMEIDWMNNYEITQAVPPAYSEHLGKQLMESLEQAA